MRMLVGFAFLVTSFSLSIAGAQSQRHKSLANAISHSFLMRLIDPKDTEYAVGMANVVVGSGVLVSPRGAPAVVEYVRGYSSDHGSTWRLSWVAAEQLEATNESTVRFEVVRKKFDEESCPALRDAVQSYYSKLELMLPRPISLSELPERRTSSDIMLDGTSYRVQIWTGESHVTITPDRDISRPMYEASQNLHSVVSGCANRDVGTIEEHIFNF